MQCVCIDRVCERERLTFVYEAIKRFDLHVLKGTGDGQMKAEVASALMARHTAYTVTITRQILDYITATKLTFQQTALQTNSTLANSLDAGSLFADSLSAGSVLALTFSKLTVS
jgi:hypothetical protein